MSVIITKEGKNAIKLDSTPFKDEDCLQKYISDNLQVIPFEDIKEESKILVLAREFETLSGPIDILVTDKDGEIYIIETKLFKNPDKRKVLAQVMDYGAALWKGYSNPNDFISDLDVKRGIGRLGYPMFF
jgi:RecB family endonuclease NucS